MMMMMLMMMMRSVYRWRQIVRAERSAAESGQIRVSRHWDSEDSAVDRRKYVKVNDVNVNSFGVFLSFLCVCLYSV